MSAEMANACVADLVRIISDNEDFGPSKVWHVYSEEELLNYQKGAIFPCVGVVYEGARAAPASVGERQGTQGGRSVQSAEFSFTILAYFRSVPQSATLDPKKTTVAMVDRLRRSIMGVRSPTGHFWKFQVEASIPGKSGVLCYLQRWATSVQLS